MDVFIYVFVFRSQQEAQERRDYELALRLAAVSCNFQSLIEEK